MKRKCHMEIPHCVFHKMERKFGELKPLFLKFVHSHINPKEVEEIVNDVDQRVASGKLKPSSKPYKRAMDVKKALNTVFRDVTGDKKLKEIKKIYERCNGKFKKTLLRHVQRRYKKEIKNPDIETSWRDFTSIYPDKFDGDNIAFGNYHSCKFADIKTLDDPLVWDVGHVCHSIQALIWRIRGLYKEFYKETDVLVSERSKVSIIEELIRLTHYVMDLSTIVHLMHTSGHFHNNFEADLDSVVDDILPKINIKIKRKLRLSFYNDAYGEADRRAKETFKKFYFPILDLYGRDTQKNNKAKRAFSQGIDLNLAEDIVQNACQNLADFWGYTLEMIDVDTEMYDHVKKVGGSLST